MGAATGDITPRENVAMVRELRRLYALLLACPTCWASGRVKWAHVKSHTEHKRNDRADALATLGYTLTVSARAAYLVSVGVRCALMAT